jgi:hypothetical protein
VVITDRGQVVAELNPPGQRTIGQSAPAGLVVLARRGLLLLGTGNDSASYPELPRLLKRGRAAQLLDEERGCRESVR